jgi:hypothetical protein
MTVCTHGTCSYVISITQVTLSQPINCIYADWALIRTAVNKADGAAVLFRYSALVYFKWLKRLWTAMMCCRLQWTPLVTLQALLHLPLETPSE